MKLAKKFKISLLFVIVCYPILGLVLLFYPGFSMTMLCYALGSIAILYGVSHMVCYFSRTDFKEIYRLDLVTGIVMTGCGIYTMVQPSVVATVLNILVGLVICLDSLIKLQGAIDLKRLGSRLWWTVLVLSFVTGILGVILILYHGNGLVSTTQLIGVSLVVDGCVNVWNFSFLTANLSRLRKTRKELLQSKEAAASESDEEARVQSALASAQREQADESVKGSILAALGALRKERSNEDAVAASADVDSGATEANAPDKTTADTQQKETSIILKPSQEELTGAALDIQMPVSLPEDVPAPKKRRAKRSEAAKDE